MMARSQLFSLACLALLASSALAAPACVPYAVNQTAALTTDKPKGCLANQLGKALQGVDAKCLNSVTLFRQGGPGCNDFDIGLDANNPDCNFGTPSVGNGTLSAAKGGGYTANGEFITQNKFTGTQSADNKTFTVSVTGYDCTLSYALPPSAAAAINGSAGNSTPAATVPGATTSRDTSASPTAASPPPSPPAGGAAAAALPSAALLVLGGVMALAL